MADSTAGGGLVDPNALPGQPGSIFPQDSPQAPGGIGYNNGEPPSLFSQIGVDPTTGSPNNPSQSYVQALMGGSAPGPGAGFAAQQAYNQGTGITYDPPQLLRGGETFGTGGGPGGSAGYFGTTTGFHDPNNLTGIPGAVPWGSSFEPGTHLQNAPQGVQDLLAPALVKYMLGTGFDPAFRGFYPGTIEYSPPINYDWQGGGMQGREGSPWPSTVMWDPWHRAAGIWQQGYNNG